jgi:hypothetical protein
MRTLIANKNSYLTEERTHYLGIKHSSLMQQYASYLPIHESCVNQQFVHCQGKKRD